MAKAGSAAAMASSPAQAFEPGSAFGFHLSSLAGAVATAGSAAPGRGMTRLPESPLPASPRRPPKKLPGARPANGLRGGFSAPLRVPRTERSFHTTKAARTAKTIVVISKEFCIELPPDFRAGPYWALIVLLSCHLFGERKAKVQSSTGAFMLRLRSNGTIMRQPIVRLPVLFVTYLALWLGAELAAFAAVVHLIGFAGAILACILTTLAGLSTLRRVGLSAILRLRQAVARRASEQSGLSREAVLDGTLAGLGARVVDPARFCFRFRGTGARRALGQILGYREAQAWQVWTAGEWPPHGAKSHRTRAAGMVAARWAVALKGFAPQEAAASSLRLALAAATGRSPTRPALE